MAGCNELFVASGNFGLCLDHIQWRHSPYLLLDPVLLDHHLREFLRGFPDVDVLFVENQVPVRIENVRDDIRGPHHKLFLRHVQAVSCDAQETAPGDSAKVLEEMLREGHSQSRGERGVQALEEARGARATRGEIDVHVQAGLEGLVDGQIVVGVQIQQRFSSL